MRIHQLSSMCGSGVLAFLLVFVSNLAENYGNFSIKCLYKCECAFVQVDFEYIEWNFDRDKEIFLFICTKIISS